MLFPIGNMLTDSLETMNYLWTPFLKPLHRSGAVGVNDLQD